MRRKHAKADQQVLEVLVRHFNKYNDGRNSGLCSLKKETSVVLTVK
jgi:hypothetical protein